MTQLFKIYYFIGEEPSRAYAFVLAASANEAIKILIAKQGNVQVDAIDFLGKPIQ